MSSRTDLKKLPEVVEGAAELGCTRCTITLAPAGDVRPYHENFEFHRRRFHDICAVLKPAGVRLAVGFLASESLRQNRAFQFIHDLDALTLLLNMAAEPNLGLLLDTWDLVACGGSVDSVRKLPPQQIVAVQVADMPASVPLAELDEKSSRLLPGGENGRIDVAGFMAALREMGYDGPVTAKPSRNAFQSRRARRRHQADQRGARQSNAPRRRRLGCQARCSRRSSVREADEDGETGRRGEKETGRKPWLPCLPLSLSPPLLASLLLRPYSNMRCPPQHALLHRVPLGQRTETDQGRPGDRLSPASAEGVHLARP